MNADTCGSMPEHRRVNEGLVRIFLYPKNDTAHCIVTAIVFFVTVISVTIVAPLINTSSSVAPSWTMSQSIKTVVDCGHFGHIDVMTPETAHVQ